MCDYVASLGMQTTLGQTQPQFFFIALFIYPYSTHGIKNKTNKILCLVTVVMNIQNSVDCQ